jgi:hypothetical protein
MEPRWEHLLDGMLREDSDYCQSKTDLCICHFTLYRIQVKGDVPFVCPFRYYWM